MGGWLQFGRGEVGWGRKRGRRRRNRGREEEIDDGNLTSVYPLVIPSVEVTRR